MAQIALPRQQVTQTQQSAQVGSPLYQRRRPSQAGPIELLPNPDFSFPMRDPETTLSTPAPAPNARPMSLQAYPTGRRGSAHARGKSINALPDFSFNPAGTSAPVATATSPQLSPMALPTTPVTPSRPIGGHRRGGSEFIGGDGRSGGTSLLSTSPTKGDDVLPAPTNNTLRPGPPAGRRGHAHRRSGAVSSHDLTSIMNPPAHPRAGSAPVTPSEGPQFAFGHSVNKSMSQPSLRDAGSLQDAEEMPRPPSRARVGFSDKVEYIRPLSTISSETETSMSTMRGHSATNSLSSVISSGTSSPQTFRNGRPTLSTVEDESRPSTAGAILGSRSNSGDDVTNRKRPSSAVSPTAIAAPNTAALPAKRRSFFRSEPRRSDPSVPTLSSVSDPALTVPIESPLPSPMLDEEEPGEQSTKTKSRKSNKAPRKVKSWASSIIPKKAKHSRKVKDRASTPPPQSTVDDESDTSEDVDFEANFDVDNTVTIVSPTDDAVTVQKTQTDYASWQPRELKRVDSDTMNPVIDLDAALGPFNGTNARTQRGFAAHRRAMHSAGGILQNHRRTESAPALVPFELRSTAAATSSTMADVFEEEEPEDDNPISSGKSTHSEPAISEEQEEAEEPKIQVVETDDHHNGSSINWNFNDDLSLKRNDRSRRDETSEPCSPRALPDSVMSVDGTTRSPGADVVEIVEDFEEPRTSSLTHSSDSTVTPQVSADDSKETHTVMNLSLPLAQQNLMTPDTFTSSFPSPDFRSSQVSLDTQRLGTAASSMTDYQAMPSPRFVGEPGPELRVSVDDVPSLTSSRSTMTSAMQSAFPLPSPRQPGDRSASLCSAPSDVESRRRKRSSIASLSRLMNTGSFGERSKLSIETRPQSEYGMLEATQKETKKKHKRLSKLMQFWKTKESKGSSRT